MRRPSKDTPPDKLAIAPGRGYSLAGSLTLVPGDRAYGTHLRVINGVECARGNRRGFLRRAAAEFQVVRHLILNLELEHPENDASDLVSGSDDGLSWAETGLDAAGFRSTSDRYADGYAIRIMARRICSAFTAVMLPLRYSQHNRWMNMNDIIKSAPSVDDDHGRAGDDAGGAGADGDVAQASAIWANLPLVL